MNEKDIINKIDDDISKKKEILKKDIAKIVKENIPFNTNDMYYFKCNGSGYYLKFIKTIDENMIFDIYTKGGKRKGKTFEIHWCYMDCIKNINIIKNN